MSLQTIRAILLADATTQGFVGDKIGPPQALEGEAGEPLPPPYIVLKVAGGEPFNQLSGFAGLNRVEVELTAWAASYQQSIDIAKAARSAIEAAGPPNYTIHEPGDETAFQQDILLYGHSFVFQTLE